jgi:peptide deformylase
VSSPDGSWTPSAGGALGGALNGLFRAASAREPVQAGTPALRDAARTLSLEQLAAPATQTLIEEMCAVSRARGVGLAAPQLGESLAIIVLEDTAEDVSTADVSAQERRPFGLKVLVNPRVTPKAGTPRVAFFEGCLSVQARLRGRMRARARSWRESGSEATQGLATDAAPRRAARCAVRQGYRGLVERALEVEVTALGGDGKPVAFTARGWQARAVLRALRRALARALSMPRHARRAFCSTSTTTCRARCASAPISAL